MGIKVIAIGNPMMGDDAIALYAVKDLSNGIQKLGIEVIIGETDVDFCISKIKNKDELIIIDSSCRGKALGSVSYMGLQEIIEGSNINSWQHDRDIIRELKIRGVEVSGLLICIEVSDIDFRWGLSTELQQMLPGICERVYGLIFGYRGEFKNA